MGYRQKSSILFYTFLCIFSISICPSYSSDQFSSDPVEINIGERGYQIPKNYLGIVRPSQNAERHERAVLWVLWPGMEPKTEKNAHLWDRRRPKRQIRIHIEASGTETYDKLQNVISLGLLDPESEDWDHGLLRYAKKSWQFFVVSEGSRLTPRRRPLAFKCNDVRPKTRELFEVELLCIAEYQLIDGAWLVVHFFLSNLDQWREIDVAARDLLERFRR